MPVDRPDEHGDFVLTSQGPISRDLVGTPDQPGPVLVDDYGNLRWRGGTEGLVTPQDLAWSQATYGTAPVGPTEMQVPRQLEAFPYPYNRPEDTILPITDAQGRPVPSAALPSFIELPASEWIQTAKAFYAQGYPGIAGTPAGFVPTGVLAPEARPTGWVEFASWLPFQDQHVRDLLKIADYARELPEGPWKNPRFRQAANVYGLVQAGLPVLPEWAAIGRNLAAAVPPEVARRIAHQIEEAEGAKKRGKMAQAAATFATMALGGLGTVLAPAFAATFGPVAGGALWGAGSALAPQLIGSAISGNWDWERLLGATAAGGVAGGLTPALTGAGLPGWAARPVAGLAGQGVRWGITGQPPSAAAVAGAALPPWAAPFVSVGPRR